MIAAEVYLWGRRIGFVAQDNVSDIPRFNYDAEFIKSGIQVSPIVMPLAERAYTFPGLREETFHTLPGLVADSLPDKFGTKLIEQYLAEQGRRLEDLTAVERLCYTGSRGMGALEYLPAQGYEDTPDATIDIDALVRLASDILTERNELHLQTDDHTMEQILKIGTSAGGARAKAVIAWNEQTGDIRSGQIDAGDGYEYWIIKFDGVENNKDKGDKADGECFTRIEYAYYLMATAAGIDMNRCILHEEAGRYHFMTKRFDRIGQTGQKLHMQSLGAIAHFDFNDPGANSYEQAAGIILRLGMGQDEIERLYRRMVFNVLARNHDDHVKNISFLMDRSGEWTLSPAYDVTFAFDPNNFWLRRHQMSVNGKLEDFRLEDLLECGRHMNLTNRKMMEIVEEVEGALERWSEFAEAAGVPEREMGEVERAFLVA